MTNSRPSAELVPTITLNSPGKVRWKFANGSTIGDRQRFGWPLLAEELIRGLAFGSESKNDDRAIFEFFQCHAMVLAAERHKSVATAEGRGLYSQLGEPRNGDRFFRRSAAHLLGNITTTAFSRGYTLMPLRG